MESRLLHSNIQIMTFFQVFQYLCINYNAYASNYQKYVLIDWINLYANH